MMKCTFSPVHCSLDTYKITDKKGIADDDLIVYYALNQNTYDTGLWLCPCVWPLPYFPNTYTQIATALSLHGYIKATEDVLSMEQFVTDRSGGKHKDDIKAIKMKDKLQIFPITVI